MKKTALQILLFDKITLALAGAVVLALSLCVFSFIYSGNIESQNSRLKTRLEEIISISDVIVETRNFVNSREKKIVRNKSAGIVSTLEQALKDLGMEAQEIKPLDKVRLDDYTEENAELEMQGTDLNSIVNFLYKLDISPLPLKVKSAAIKTSFQDPEKFTLKLTVSLISKT